MLVAMAVWADAPAWANMLHVIVSTIQYYTVGGGEGGPAVPVAVGGDEPAEAVAPVELPAASEPPIEQPAEQPAEPAVIADEVRTLESPQTAREKLASNVPTPRPKTKKTPPVDDKPSWQPFDEPLEPSALSNQIDEQLAALWAAQRIAPAGPASDAEFMRRAFLDLTGRVPTVGEARDFLEDQALGSARSSWSIGCWRITTMRLISRRSGGGSCCRTTWT